LVNSVDNDGTLIGPDLVLTRLASEMVNVPVITMGGVSSLQDIKACFDAGASGVGVGAFFIFYGIHRAVLISYPTMLERKKNGLI